MEGNNMNFVLKNWVEQQMDIGKCMGIKSYQCDVYIITSFCNSEKVNTWAPFPWISVAVILA